MPKRESEAATRALEQLEIFFKAPEPQTTLVLVAAARQAQPDVQAAVEARDDRRVRRDRGSGGRRALGADASRRPARRSIRRAARLLAERAGTDVKRLRGEVDRLLLYALGQKQHHRRRRPGGRRPGGAAGRLGDDQRDRGRAGRRGAAAARVDARRRRAAGKDPRSARLAGAGEVSGDRAADCRPRSRRCSGRTWT